MPYAVFLPQLTLPQRTNEWVSEVSDEGGGRRLTDTVVGLTVPLVVGTGQVEQLLV